MLQNLSVCLKPLQQTLQEIHDQLLHIFTPPTCYIALVDSNEDVIEFPCVLENHQRITRQPLPLSNQDSLVAWVIRNNVPFATDNWPLEAKPIPGISGDGSPHSIICVPMRLHGEVLGAISIQSDEPDAFDAADFPDPNWPLPPMSPSSLKMPAYLRQTKNWLNAEPMITKRPLPCDKPLLLLAPHCRQIQLLTICC